MPLSELHPTGKGKSLPSSRHRTFTTSSTDLYFAPDSDFVELVWENGHVIAQNQSNFRPRKYPDSSISPPHILKSCDEDAAYSKMVKHCTHPDIADFPLSLTSDEELRLNQDDDIMMPWLNCPIINDSLQSKYLSDFVPDASGVTYINQHSTPNDFPSIRKTGSCRPGFDEEESHNNVNLEQREISSLSMPKVPEIIHKNTSQFCSSNVVTQSSELPSVSPGSFTNFSCFGSIGSMLSPDILSRNKDMDSFDSTDKPFSAMPNDSMSTLQCEKLPHNQPSLVMSKPQSYILQEKTARSKNDQRCEMTREPVVASSSVCSGSTMEATSNNLMCNKKRKFFDMEESEDPSDALEDETRDVKKEAPARRSTGSKRGRAAEVHNLSERRRRDRINEKMRALQELIPNCNKVDKASMLDEAIEYLKALQLQVQIMSMRTGLCMPPPVMFPAHMGMGFGMGFGMMDMYKYQAAAATATMQSNPSSFHVANSKDINTQTAAAQVIKDWKAV